MPVGPIALVASFRTLCYGLQPEEFSWAGDGFMRATAFWKTVTRDHTGFLTRLISLLEAEGIRYCVVGGQAVNAYAEPVVSLDLDVVIALDQLSCAQALLAATFRV